MQTQFSFNMPEFHSAYQKMHDTVGFIRNYFNPCWHLHLIQPSDGVDQLWYDAGYSSVGPAPARLDFSGGSLRPEGIEERLLTAVNSLPGLNDWLDDFSVAAEDHFITAADDTYSLMNFLIELIQLCEGNVIKLKELIEKIQRALKAFWKIYKQTGNYWLSWNFAIKPTIKDIKAIINTLEKARKRIKFLKKWNHIPVDVKYRRGHLERESYDIVWPITECRYVNSDFDLFQRKNQTPSVIESQCSWILYDVKIAITPAAHALVVWDIDDAYLQDDAFSLGTFWAAMSGLYKPLDIAWEATPYTWLIDWFLSKRVQALKDLADCSPLKDAKILESGHSLKIEVMARLGYIEKRVDWVPYTSMDRPAAHDVQHDLGPVRLTLYKRRPGLPNVEASPVRIPLEWYNFSILAALIQQKRRR